MLLLITLGRPLAQLPARSLQRGARNLRPGGRRPIAEDRGQRTEDPRQMSAVLQTLNNQLSTLNCLRQRSETSRSALENLPRLRKRIGRLRSSFFSATSSAGLAF